MTRRLPPEWAPQDAVLLIWPGAGDARDDRADALENACGALAVAITRFEPLLIACRDPATRTRAVAQLQQLGCPRAAFATVTAPSDGIRARDLAPITVIDGELPLCVACGSADRHGRDPGAHDAGFGRALLDAPGFATLGRERAAIALGGGSIDTDGAGTALANRQELLDPARNPSLDAAGAQASLRRQFGLERLHWLDLEPLPGDLSGGQVDTFARFTEVGSVVHAAAHGADDPAAATLDALDAQLAALRGAGGAPLERVALPNPAPIRDAAGNPCPAGYTGFLVVNDAVLVPAFAEPNDAVAVERLQECFPGRTALPVPARTLAAHGHSLHALAMQWPRGTLQDLVLL